MAEETLKDFTVNWILTGLLFTALLSFTILFMANNSTIGLSDNASEIFGNSQTTFNSRLQNVSNEADDVLNITANTNPEVSELGSRDSVASSFQNKKTASGYWQSTKVLLSWIFSGTIGKTILASIAGII